MEDTQFDVHQSQQSGQFVEMMAINFKSELTNEKYEEQF